ncbi:MAG: hypothetical protein Q8Q35_02315 [Nanoarchaeota archaeon]|nr:hypothetical protein [Nanoarchaeota archaeon]
MVSEIPIQEALELINRGLSNEEITRKLEAKGFNLQQISDAISQANIKKGVEGNMPEQNMQESSMNQEIPLPKQEHQIAVGQPVQEQAYQQQQAYYPQQQSAPNYADTQAIVEQIIEEKWRALMKDVGDISVFKARVSDDMEAVKQELIRTQRRLEDLQVAVMGKVKDYHTGVSQIGSDMKALEQVFSKILEPLTMNIKELGRITNDLKGHKKK